jgi:Tol biopolymer transport system component
MIISRAGAVSLSGSVLCLMLSWPPPRATEALAAQRPALTIAFAANYNGNFDIYSTTVGASEPPVQLTDDVADDFAPAWSPDGSRIAFWSKRDGNQQLYVMEADGSNETVLTANPQPDNPHGRWAPDWSPNGMRIAFEMNQDVGVSCNCTNIYTIKADGTGLRRITREARLDAGPAWTPSGRALLFARQGEATSAYPDLWKIRLREPWLQTQLTLNDAYEWSPTVSPDGEKIMFQSNRPRSDGSFDLFVMARDGTGVRRLWRDDRWQSEPAWSPDGRWIAYVEDVDGPLHGLGCFGTPPGCSAQAGPEPSDIWLSRPDGSQAQLVVGDPDFEEISPSIRPYGGVQA